jgi:hypothetical protein
MAADGIFGSVRGLPDIKRELAAVPGKLRVRALRNALGAGARVVQRLARRLAPVLKLTTRAGQYAYRRGFRKPGTLRQAISVRTSKLARRRGDVGVFVNVRPARGAARGAKSPRDAFYWRWLEFGWLPAAGAARAQRSGARLAMPVRVAPPKKKAGAAFLRGSVGALNEALQVFLRQIGPAIAKLNRPKAPPP